MVVMAICVFGSVSYQQLTLSLMPEISYPTLTVRRSFQVPRPKRSRP